MITHFSQLQLTTVSLPGVRQFYHDLLHFPVIAQTDTEIRFQPAPHLTLSFREALEPLRPAHLAFEVPYSQFDHVIDRIQRSHIPLLAWPDGRTVDDFGGRKNVYFRDGDGHLLEIITHSYITEGILQPSGELNILYLREVGLPVESVVQFRETLVRLFSLKLDRLEDDFTFAIGGTAHFVIVSKQRRWIPIAMAALPPSLQVTLGISRLECMETVMNNLKSEGISYDFQEDQLYFTLNGFDFCLKITDFDDGIPKLLNLPLSR
ncbi:glyoxalase/bleomycin resistance/dioxygenase family protein [Paenibacillus filicis]|uniref:Glyoxalase/bleomycin resistance/dioxygenase family protein n=1 Tax=Paenibacillus filicis TaxID=669464 RepID=A0ABU9DEC1_9BACL